MHIVFDLDGTLFQTEHSIIFTVKELANRIGVNLLSDTDIISNIGKTTDEFLQTVFPHEKITEKNRKWFRTVERENVKKYGKLYPGTEKMLKKLIELGHSISICSNGSDEYINHVISNMGIAKYFDNIQSAKNFDSKSGALNNILKVNKNAVFVGDTIQDINAAHTNKIPVIAVSYGYGNSNDLTQSTFLANTIEEVEKYIALTDIFYRITNELIYKGKRIIGISGVDTSGKTLFAKNISRFWVAINIKNEIIHIDDFHNSLNIRTKGDNEIDAYYNNAFNYEQIINEILVPLKKTGNINKEILCLNIDTDKYENSIHYDIDSNTVLLIEGVLLFRPPIIEYLDGKVFLNVDFDEVLRRAEIRDVPKYGKLFLEKYKVKYIPIQKLYLSEYQPQKNCDILINNKDYKNPKIEPSALDTRM